MNANNTTKSVLEKLKKGPFAAKAGEAENNATNMAA